MTRIARRVSGAPGRRTLVGVFFRGLGCVAGLVLAVCGTPATPSIRPIAGAARSGRARSRGDGSARRDCDRANADPDRSGRRRIREPAAVGPHASRRSLPDRERHQAVHRDARLQLAHGASSARRPFEPLAAQARPERRRDHTSRAAEPHERDLRLRRRPSMGHGEDRRSRAPGGRHASKSRSPPRMHRSSRRGRPLPTRTPTTSCSGSSIEAVTGTTLAQQLHDRLTRPLGLRSTLLLTKLGVERGFAHGPGQPARLAGPGRHVARHQPHPRPGRQGDRFECRGRGPASSPRCSAAGC